MPAADNAAVAATEPSEETSTAEKPAETEAEDGAAEEAKPEVPKMDFSAHLPATSADDEARKRAERAKRFGISEENDEEKRKTDRAQRFGLDQSDLTKSLDSALPEKRRPKRGREGGDGGYHNDRNVKRLQGGGRHRGNRGGGRGGQLGRGGRDSGGRGGGRYGGASGGRRDGRPSGGRSIQDDPSEKNKAEARAKRFSGAT